MAQEPEVVRVAREYREQLARQEDEALRLIADYWVKIEKRTESEFIALAAEIQDMIKNGEVVDRDFIFRSERFKHLMDQIREEIPGYESEVLDTIERYQTENYTLGLDAANAVIKASNPFDDQWMRVPKEAVKEVVGFARNGTPLSSLLKADYTATASRIVDELVIGVGMGKGPRQVAANMADAMGRDSGSRALRIARTEMARAYRQAEYRQFQESRVVTKVFRLCHPPTACLACLMMDGEECPNGLCDDHPNGKCTTVVETIGGNRPTWHTGREWFMEQDEKTQRGIMGDGRYEMWKNQGIDPKSMVYIKPNDVWGGSPTTKSEKELEQLLREGKL